MASKTQTAHDRAVVDLWFSVATLIVGAICGALISRGVFASNINQIKADAVFDYRCESRSDEPASVPVFDVDGNRRCIGGGYIIIRESSNTEGLSLSSPSNPRVGETTRVVSAAGSDRKYSYLPSYESR